MNEDRTCVSFDHNIHHDRDDFNRYAYEQDSKY